MPDPATPPQFEGQEHEFLDYQLVVVHFIYSFSWDVTNRTWQSLKDDLVVGKHQDDGAPKAKEWKERQLHERLFAANAELANSYQPNLVGKTTVFEKTGNVASNATLLSPLEEPDGLTLKACRKLTVPLRYTIRLFDNGSGTCTFAAQLSKELATFENIHLVLHLANNVDFGEAPVSSSHLLTNTFLQIPNKYEGGRDESLLPRGTEYSYTYGSGYCSLHDLFRRWIVDPPSWAPDDPANLWTDPDVLYTKDPKQDFQTPFVFTAAEVERNSFLRHRKSPTIDHARELGSILCKLTLDNRHIREHYLNLSDDYITTVLPFNKMRGGLVNLCLDRRLFFALSRRGAIALTSSFKDIPSCFVIPSLLNLCEILRARWHLGSIVNIKLDEALQLASGVDPEISPSHVLEELFKWRALFASFFRDPVPFLFDGGSITEIAEIAEQQLWLAKMRDEVARKFAILDRMIEDLYARKRVEDLTRWSGSTS